MIKCKRGPSPSAHVLLMLGSVREPGGFLDRSGQVREQCSDREVVPLCFYLVGVPTY